MGRPPPACDAVEEGQTVYLQWFSTRRPRTVPPLTKAKITKIGRKWAYVGSARFEMDDQSPKGFFSIDGGDYSSPGRVWLSVAEHEEFVKRSAAWGELRLKIGMPGLPNVSSDRLQEIIDELWPKEAQE